LRARREKDLEAKTTLKLEPNGTRSQSLSLTLKVQRLTFAIMLNDKQEDHSWVRG
jgi:hypothetical protein